MQLFSVQEAAYHVKASCFHENYKNSIIFQKMTFIKKRR